MKKYITLLSFVALFFLGFQQTQAQDSKRVVEAEMPEAIAKKQTHDLHQINELTGDQQVAVYKVLVDYQYNVKALNSNSDIATVQKAKAALMDNVKASLKTILKKEQYLAFLKSLEKPKE